MDNRVFAHRGEFALRQVGTESILVPVRNHVGDLDSVYVFTAVAATIWSLIDGSRDVDSIVAAICGEYDAEPDVVRSDLEELLGSLEGAALIGAAIEARP
ncbi:MAG: PqqD family protein [Thermoanaerobaculia bacterium]